MLRESVPLPMSHQMKWKLLKAAATFAVLWLLFARLQHVLPKTLWVLLFLATLTYGISLFFSEKIPAAPLGNRPSRFG
jgi:hypothetical protein